MRSNKEYGIAHMFEETVPSIGGSPGERMQTLKRTGDLGSVEGGGGRLKVMGRNMAGK